VGRAKGKPTLRHGVTKWRDAFIAAGKAGLEEGVSGPPSMSATERRIRAGSEQPKLALAEATVQLRIWQKGAELAGRRGN
jgi:transposase